MKNLRILTPVLLLSLLVSFGLQAQDKVKEKKLLGNWKLIIDLEEAFEEAEKEMKEEEENIFAKIVLNSVSGLVTGLLEELEVYMEFLPAGEVKIIVEAFDEREIEYSKWYIDNDGRLFIEDTDSYSSDSSDDNGFWLFEDGVLVLYQDNGRKSEVKKNVYLVNMDAD